MFGQKFTNTNKMLQCLALYCADFGAANLAQLNTAKVATQTDNYLLVDLLSYG
jgi:hypothetical protein